jgi:polycomb protein EED
MPKMHVDVPVVIHYPHFSTSEVHSGLVDCAIFFGDLILSRACHDEVIVLWRIEGFSSADPPPPPSRAPTTFDPSQLTRSAFAPKSSLVCPSPYTRLLQFSTPGCGVQFFMRFSIFHIPGQHAMLAFCNAASKIYFWDLQRLTDYAEFVSKVQDPSRDRSVSIDSLRPAWLKPIHHRKAEGGSQKDRASTDGVQQINQDLNESASKLLLKEYSSETVTNWESRYSSWNPHGLVKPHKEELVNKYNKERKRVAYSFVGRQVAWSPAGEWCVVVGSQNLAVILQRWAPDRDKVTPLGVAG